MHAKKKNLKLHGCITYNITFVQKEIVFQKNPGLTNWISIMTIKSSR